MKFKPSESKVLVTFAISLLIKQLKMSQVRKTTVKSNGAATVQDIQQDIDKFITCVRVFVSHC